MQKYASDPEFDSGDELQAGVNPTSSYFQHMLNKGRFNEPKVDSIFTPRARKVVQGVSALDQLKNFRRDSIRDNPELYSALLNPADHDSKRSGFAKITAGIKDKFANDISDLDQMEDPNMGNSGKSRYFKPPSQITNALSPENLNKHLQSLKNSGDLGKTLGILLIKSMPMVARNLENIIKKKNLKYYFRQLGLRTGTFDRVHGLYQIMNCAGAKREFFDRLKQISENDTVNTEKMRAFYKLNLKRIFFNTLKDFTAYQKEWIFRMKNSIKKSAVFDVLRKNAYNERMKRRTKLYHKSRLFGAFHKACAERLQARQRGIANLVFKRNLRAKKACVEELNNYVEEEKQLRKKEQMAGAHFQKISIFKVFEYWKSLPPRKRNRVDFAMYKNMHSIPIRVSQKKRIEVLDEDFSKVITSENVKTTYRFLHPATKI
jgi:hypothetical protein